MFSWQLVSQQGGANFVCHLLALPALCLGMGKPAMVVVQVQGAPELTILNLKTPENHVALVELLSEVATATKCYDMR